MLVHIYPIGLRPARRGWWAFLLQLKTCHQAKVTRSGSPPCVRRRKQISQVSIYCASCFEAKNM